MNPDELSHQYDSIADSFEKAIEEGNKASKDAMRARLPDMHGKSALDIGCGEGTDAAFYLESGASRVAGLDASKELLEKAKQKHPGIDFQYGLFEKIPFGDGEFDFVFSKYALMTSAELEPAFVEVQRVLKPGGVFMFVVTHPIRQFYEKRKEGKDYFKKEIVDSVCFDGLITFREPTHTLKEYLSEYMLSNFTLEAYEECFDPAAEKIVDTYPGFVLLKWQKR
ncbi:MAG: class I SAM-dependent methyltransferase [Patescibacteria group bacterium]